VAQGMLCACLCARAERYLDGGERGGDVSQAVGAPIILSADLTWKTTEEAGEGKLYTCVLGRGSYPSFQFVLGVA
jgi:hypothetical protein